jgi:DNA-binding transcriptional regulator YiaG
MQNWLEKKTDKLLQQAKEMTHQKIRSIRASYGLTQVLRLTETGE